MNTQTIQQEIEKKLQELRELQQAQQKIDDLKLAQQQLEDQHNQDLQRKIQLQAQVDFMMDEIDNYLQPAVDNTAEIANTAELLKQIQSKQQLLMGERNITILRLAKYLGNIARLQSQISGQSTLNHYRSLIGTYAHLLGPNLNWNNIEYQAMLG